MRETLASLFLRQCGYDGSEPVVDPMCGSGTFVIEAAEIAAGLKPGRSRHFAFEHLATFDEAAWMRDARRDTSRDPSRPLLRQRPRCRRDRDEPRQRRARRRCRHHRLPTARDQRSPAADGPPGSSSSTRPTAIASATRRGCMRCTARLAQTLKDRFAGWRVGLITNEARSRRRPACRSCRLEHPCRTAGCA